MMEDIEIAMGFLSRLLRAEIITLELKPQEYTRKKKGSFVVFRMDFKAVIRLKNGRKKVILIEIQKAKKEKIVLRRRTKGGKISREEESHIWRFRRYLGDAYVTLEMDTRADGTQVAEALPVVAIYFLGFNLNTVDQPVVILKSSCEDLITGEVLDPQPTEDFFDLLSHEMIVIQIPRLQMELRNELEQVLDIFNQDKYQTDDNTVLDYTGNTKNKLVERMVSRLNEGLKDEKTMFVLREEQIAAREERELRKAAAQANKWRKKSEKAVSELLKTNKQLNITSEKLTETSEKLTETSEKLTETSEKLLAESKAKEEEQKARERAESENARLLQELAELRERLQNKNGDSSN
jgi:hypothetical protein